MLRGDDNEGHNMSVCHIHFLLKDVQGCKATYSVETFGFHSSGNSEVIGTVCIDQEAHSYTFTAGTVWIQQKGIPPAFMGLSPEERNARIQQENTEHYCQLWAFHIHKLATTISHESGFEPTRFSIS